MSRFYKRVTITVHPILLKQFKEFCQLVEMPLSEFFSQAGQELLAKLTKIDTHTHEQFHSKVSEQ